ncbi:MAG: D-2-hydroxyacid dehydrogenase [Chloroflexota bacterium]|nr:D-2-hydroxyacid dehydrogenase [Dehalococcoidia bacterium]MDW8253061.1 D-2-hydroxyacid dehydrogenase [Chloroflexota bacterium]
MIGTRKSAGQPAYNLLDLIPEPAMTVKAAIAGTFSAEEWELLRAVPDVELVDLSVWGSWHPPAPPESEQYRALVAALPSQLAGVEALLLMGPARPLVDCAPDLKWIQIPWAGLDQVAAAGVFERGIVVTNAKGLNARYVAEWALAAILAFAKNLPRYIRQQPAKCWDRHPALSLEEITVGIVGLGTIGSELARRAQALGMRVIAIRRSGPAAPPPGVAWLGGPADLDRLLAEADVVVLTAPHTAETRGLIGARQLQTMKRSAYLVNVARGALVDEEALAAALREGVIAGAALDVFQTEPLPPSSPLWDLDNVILTPHVSGSYEGHFHRVLRLFIANLERYIAGQPLLNVCDPEKGY